MAKKPCKHYWLQPHTVWQGRKQDGPDGVGVLRYCSRCGVVQMAFAAEWGPKPKGYVIGGETGLPTTTIFPERCSVRCRKNVEATVCEATARFSPLSPPPPVPTQP